MKNRSGSSIIHPEDSIEKDKDFIQRIRNLPESSLEKITQSDLSLAYEHYKNNKNLLEGGSSILDPTKTTNTFFSRNYKIDPDSSPKSNSNLKKTPSPT